MKKLLVFQCFLMLPFFLLGQNIFERNISVPVKKNGGNLQLPWVGGLNHVQMSGTDLNNDGLKDLVIFDRAGNRVTTLLNTGGTGVATWIHAPEYQAKFPKMQYWMLMADYNCDGFEDIFTQTTGGMKLFKNDFLQNNELEFSLITNLIYSNYLGSMANILVYPTYLPALIDVDNDGDLDILTFDLQGFRVEYHENLSMDSLAACDTMYRYATGCWGKFQLSSFGNSAIMNSPCVFVAPGDSSALPENSVHGATSVLALDLDDDGVKDLILGDLFGNNLIGLYNGGDIDTALIVAQDTLFPSYDVSANSETYPAPFYVDVDNDGVKDLIAAATNLNSYNGIWWYKNTGTNSNPYFEFQQTGFLQDRMIEVGEGANAVFYDYDKDGLVDILIGNYGYYQGVGNYLSGIAVFKNIGTSTFPEFEWITDDWQGLMSFNFKGIYPTFGDLDGDGDDDMLIGESDGRIFHFVNSAGAGNPPIYVYNPSFPVIDVGNSSAPQLYDINKNGKLDLVIGERSGNLNYYENTGSLTVPDFTFVSDSLGGIDVKQIGYSTGFSTPFMYDHNGSTRLFVGSTRGYIFQYNDIDGNLSGNFNLLDSIYQDIVEGANVTVSLADINNDTLKDMLIGNQAGGLSLFKQSTSTSTETVAVNQNLNITVYPNPAISEVMISIDGNISNELDLMLIDITGRTVLKTRINSRYSYININSLSPGIYILNISSGNLYIRKKVLKY